jgi:hypothetical protein
MSDCCRRSFSGSELTNVSMSKKSSTRCRPYEFADRSEVTAVTAEPQPNRPQSLNVDCAQNPVSETKPGKSPWALHSICYTSLQIKPHHSLKYAWAFALFQLFLFLQNSITVNICSGCRVPEPLLRQDALLGSHPTYRRILLPRAHACRQPLQQPGADQYRRQSPEEWAIGSKFPPLGF